MRKLFKHMSKAALLLLVTLAFLQVNAQRRYSPVALSDYQYTIKNDVQTSDRTYEFDLRLKDPDATLPFELSIIQAGVLVNSAIINGGTITVTLVPNSSQLVPGMRPTAAPIWVTGTPNGCLKITPKSGLGCGNGTIITVGDTGTRHCRVIITNTQPFAQAQANLAFNFTISPYPTKVFQYFGTPCVSNTLIMDATNCFSLAVNPILNAPPVVVTSAATLVTTTSAQLNGSISANATTTTPVFEYGLTTAYELGTIGGIPVPVTGTAPTTVSGALSGLIPCTTYYYRLKGNYVTTYSTSGTVYGLGLSFTTGCLPPTVVTTAASVILTNGATLNGTVNANSVSTIVTFEWGETTDYFGGSVTADQSPVTGTSITNCSYVLSGLVPAKFYHFRIKGVSASGTSYGDDMTFTTDASVPVLSTVITVAATNVVPTSARLNGTVNANGTATTVTFEWGLSGTPPYDHIGRAATPPLVSGTTDFSVLVNLTGELSPSTVYHFRCVGHNAAGWTYGDDMQFTTPAITLPTVITTAATALLPAGATLNGIVTANGASTAVTFDWGLTTTYLHVGIAGTPSPVTGMTPTNVSLPLSGLDPSTCYHFRCVGVNSSGTTYGDDLTFCTPCPPAGQAGPITGPTQVCQGGCYVYTVTIPYATGYVWIVPVGGTITSGANTNSITVCYAANAVSGYVYVYGTSTCGSGSPSFLGVAMNPPANPTITGPASVCVNSCVNVYTTQSGMTNYNWVVSPPGSFTITSGGTTSSSSITVCWNTVGAKTVSVIYTNANGCSSLAPFVYNVTVNPLPVPTITGPTPACTNYPTVYSTEAGMTGYVWSITAGSGTITGQGTNSITVTWTATGLKTVCVNYINANGCTAAAPVCKNVMVNAGAAPTITGMTTVCMNSGYITYTTEPGMTGYLWTISGTPANVISYGLGTNSIMVSWGASGAQWVKVNYTNANGCAAYTVTQLNVTVNPIPAAAGDISGTPDVCGCETGVVFSVDPIQDASTYVWTLPAGASIVSGAGTNTITVNFACDAASGDITVYGNNVCGNGTASPAYTIVVTPKPATPVITEDLGILTSSATTGNQWYFNGSLILNATDQVYDAIATGNGDYYVIVTINGCSSDQSNIVNITNIGVNDLTNGTFSIYPIPNEGRFTVSIVSPSQETFTISVYNNIGMKVYEVHNIVVNGTLDKVIDLKPIAPGIYSVVLQSSKIHVEKKILINK